MALKRSKAKPPNQISPASNSSLSDLLQRPGGHLTFLVQENRGQARQHPPEGRGDLAQRRVQAGSDLKGDLIHHLVLAEVMARARESERGKEIDDDNGCGRTSEEEKRKKKERRIAFNNDSSIRARKRDNGTEKGNAQVKRNSNNGY